MERRSLEIIEALVEAGANLESQGPNFRAPLSVAAMRGYGEIIEYLIERGANIEALGEMNETPLIEAAWFGQPEVAAILLKRGANPHAKTAFDETAQDIARRNLKEITSGQQELKSRYEEVIRLLSAY